MTVAELLARVSSRELTEWMAYERLTGPLGGERADHHAALVAQTVANVNRGKRARRHKLSDFLIKWHQQKQTAQDMLAIFRMWAARRGERGSQ